MQRNAIDPVSSIEETPCLCQALFGRPAAQHKIKYSRQRNEYLIFCPSCGFMTRPDSNLQSVKADWICSNRTGDPHIAMLWEQRLEEINEGGPAGPPEKGTENEADFSEPDGV